MTCRFHCISGNQQAASAIVAGMLECKGFQEDKNLQRRLHLVQDSAGKLVGGSLTTHVTGTSLAVQIY
jgi:hypothetical protein